MEKGQEWMEVKGKVKECKEMNGKVMKGKGKEIILGKK